MTTTPIEFWFDFASPYAYFAACEIDALAARHGRVVRWRPFLLAVMFRETGMQPLDRTPHRGDYARRDWARLARRAGIAFALPPGHPPATVHVARAHLFVEAADPTRAPVFGRAVFEASFIAGRDIAERSVIVAIAGSVGLDPAAVETALDDDTWKQALRRQTDEALARGIFGAPFVVVDGEPFWGADRLAMVDDWLATGGW